MKCLCLFLAFLCGYQPSTAGSATKSEVVRWTMVNVTPNDDIGDCHVLQFPDGATILIDMGLVGDSPNAVVNALKALDIKTVDLAVVSHFHIDHYGALLDVHDAGISIHRVVVNVPDKAAAEPEMPWGCNLAHVQSVLDGLSARNIAFHTPKIGERLWDTRSSAGAHITVDVVCLFDGLNTPIGRTDVNDTSIILRLSVGSTRALFTGDLNHRLGTYLATSDFDLAADLLKVPHHGVERAAPNQFFDRVRAKAALVPTSRKLWESTRAARIRDYFESTQVPTFVAGRDGNVIVEMTDRGFKISTER